MRRLIALVEGASARAGAHMLHVSSLENLASIRARGLVANERGGNYAGYHSSLDGVYVTDDPDVIRKHVLARGVEEGFLLAVVRVGATAATDEDALDDLMSDAHAAAGDGEDAAAAEVGAAMVPHLRRALGPGAEALDDGFLAEFCEGWVSEWMHGGDGPDPDWWVEAKTRIADAVARFREPDAGARSLRLPSPVGFDGDSRIVALVAARQGLPPETVFGAVPPDARELVRAAASRASGLRESRGGADPTPVAIDLINRAAKKFGRRRLSGGNCGTFALALAAELTERGFAPGLAFVFRDVDGVNTVEDVIAAETDIYHVVVTLNGRMFDATGETSAQALLDLARDQYGDEEPRLMEAGAADRAMWSLVSSETDWNITAGRFRAAMAPLATP